MYHLFILINFNRIYLHIEKLYFNFSDCMRLKARRQYIGLKTPPVPVAQTRTLYKIYKISPTTNIE